MRSANPQIIPLALATVGACLIGTALAFAQERREQQDFDSCKIIADDQSRLNCLRKLLPAPGATTTEEGSSDWTLVRTPRPNGGPDAVAITRTADTPQSDPDLAGLMIRCQEKPGLEVILALVRPLPPRSKRDVVVNLGSTESTLHAEVSSIGTGLILPIDATAFTTGPFRALKVLSVKIHDPENDIRGTIPLTGIAPAMAKLSASCPSG